MRVKYGPHLCILTCEGDGDSSDGDGSEDDSSEDDSSEGDSSDGDSSDGDSSEDDSGDGDGSEDDSSDGDSGEGDSSDGDSSTLTDCKSNTLISSSVATSMHCSSVENRSWYPSHDRGWTDRQEKNIT